MLVKFKTVFSLTLLHEYYEGSFNDLVLVVPEVTARDLKNSKILVRELDGVYHFLCEFLDCFLRILPTSIPSSARFFFLLCYI